MANRLISESIRPRRLPRLAFPAGIPAGHRVMVVMPALLTDRSGVAHLVDQLERHYLANPEDNAQFALLTDFTDADALRVAADEALLAAAVLAIDALNRSHPAAPGQVARFLLLHRERTWSATEGKWIGSERKRGKLEQLITALADGNAGPFLPLGGRVVTMPGTRYVLTLDSDTQLPPGRLRELVSIAAHPLNEQEATPYHWLFAGQCGVDPYSAANSEVYQDLFGEGTFTGKGLLHVGAMHAVLAKRLPDERILSHDLLEGAFARCGAVTDVTVVEDMPIHADVAAARVHRWTRGDWQLLVVLLHPRRYPIDAVSRWKMLDNLRRSLVAPMSLALLVASLLTPLISPFAVLALVAAAFCGGPMIGALTGLVPTARRLAPGYFYGKGMADVAR
ncbi:MAG: hypothetical protein B7Z52_07890, partial [Burkholderiales bacterium 12-64-5]